MALTAIFLAQRTEKGTGGTVVKKPAEMSEVRLAGDAAHDYDPAGDGHESEDATRYAIDGVRGTNWNTERYEGGFAGNNNKPGVGIYVDAGKQIAARGLAITTATPGSAGSRLGEPCGVDQRRVSVSLSRHGRETHLPAHDEGTKFRNYLSDHGARRKKSQIQELGC